MRKKLKLGILSFALLTAIFTGCSKDDTTSPLIALTGSDETYSLPSVAGGNAAWVEPGYTATDEEDGTITAKVSVSGTVDLNTKGIYTITYSVSDEAGNSASATRTVRVVNDVEMFAGSWIDCYDSSYNFGTVSIYDATIVTSSTVNKAVQITGFGGFGSTLSFEASFADTTVGALITMPTPQPIITPSAITLQYPVDSYILTNSATSQSFKVIFQWNDGTNNDVNLDIFTR